MDLLVFLLPKQTDGRGKKYRPCVGCASINSRHPPDPPFFFFFYYLYQPVNDWPYTWFNILRGINSIWNVVFFCLSCVHVFLSFDLIFDPRCIYPHEIVPGSRFHVRIFSGAGLKRHETALFASSFVTSISIFTWQLKKITRHPRIILFCIMRGLMFIFF
jgi:hypothetical protein